MGKKKSRTTYSSKGERSNVTSSIVKLVRRGVSLIDKEAHKRLAWEKGKNPWVTEKNPVEGTNRPYIKVRSNDVWGDPKRRSPNLFNSKGPE